MKLHLVFDSATSVPLSEALRARGYEITGTDATLEQFLLAADAGQINCDLAIVDAAAGVIHKQDSVRYLRLIRGNIPDTRLIVVMPAHANETWISEIGALGIYDVYAVEQFTIDDVQHWIQSRKTIRDLGDSKPEAKGRISERKGKLVSKESKTLFGIIRRKEKSKKTTSDTPKVIYTTIGSRIVAVGGLHRRAGTTHTAIQLAVLLSSGGWKTALVEFRFDDRQSDLNWIKSAEDEESFTVEGIDCYPSCKMIGEIISRGYDAVVLDVGTLDKSDALEEWRRAAVRVMTLGASPWDIGRQHLSSFANDQASIVINFATQDMFETVFEWLKHHGKLIVHNRSGYDPFRPDASLMPVISDFFPEKRRKVF